MDTNTKDSNKLLHCSFCGKNQNEVNKLIAGPSVFICDECVDLCNEIIRDEYQTNQLSQWAPESDLPLTSICFNVKPGSGGWWCGYGWTQNII